MFSPSVWPIWGFMFSCHSRFHVFPSWVSCFPVSSRFHVFPIIWSHRIFHNGLTHAFPHLWAIILPPGALTVYWFNTALIVGHSGSNLKQRMEMVVVIVATLLWLWMCLHCDYCGSFPRMVLLTAKGLRQTGGFSQNGPTGLKGSSANWVYPADPSWVSCFPVSSRFHVFPCMNAFRPNTTSWAIVSTTPVMLS